MLTDAPDDVSNRKTLAIDFIQEKMYREMDNDVFSCKKCNRAAQVLYLPCRHLITCKICALTMSSCCICDTKIDYVMNCLF